ncbi:MAG: multiprotein bridging factor aMBF1 [Sulfolobales archaeon]|nr:multiprotein bridging factor aMBF1 [Sulfolobales archaeon]
MLGSAVKYCDLCGAPLRGKGHTVVYEGGIITVCDSCYSRIAKFAKPYNLERTAQKAQQRPRQTNKTVDKELMVVDDYPTIIKNARERLGMTQKDLADKLKVSEGVIKRFEAGKLRPTLEQARELERVLGVKLILEVPSGGEQSKYSRDALTLGDVAVVRERK